MAFFFALIGKMPGFPRLPGRPHHGFDGRLFPTSVSHGDATLASSLAGSRVSSLATRRVPYRRRPGTLRFSIPPCSVSFAKSPAWMSSIATVFVLSAALLYTVAVLCLKRATDWRPGPWRVTFLCNWATTILFAPLWLWGDTPVDWSLWWQPILIATLFVGGQALVVVALNLGDVSIATPLMGLKILIVTAITLTVSWLGYGDGKIPSDAWKLITAAVLSTVAVAMLGASGAGGHHRRLLLTAAASIGAAVCYAIFDCLLQYWGPVWSTTRLMPLVMGWAGVLSIGLVPFFSAPLRRLEPAALPWIAGGAFLMALQAVFLTCTISTWGHAAEANVLYSSRGLWAVVLIWMVGHWFSKSEQAAGGKVMTQRLIAAGLLSIAIVLVV
ncbi:hypothetical protein Mal65_24570 [Crateriforma conspicua]|nr:hypothetical protein Mal65_24570 [Crateriforma conspicua]